MSHNRTRTAAPHHTEQHCLRGVARKAEVDRAEADLRTLARKAAAGRRHSHKVIPEIPAAKAAVQTARALLREHVASCPDCSVDLG